MCKHFNSRAEAEEDLKANGFKPRENGFWYKPPPRTVTAVISPKADKAVLVCYSEER